MHFWYFILKGNYFSLTGTTVKKIIVPLSMNERAFHLKIRETFPTMGEGEIEICRVDKKRRVLPVQLSSICPASIKACPEFGRSAVYVRFKVSIWSYCICTKFANGIVQNKACLYCLFWQDTSRLNGVQHENNEVNCERHTKVNLLS